MAGEITDLLHRWSRGDEAALDHLVPLVYGELRRIARRSMRRERSDHTLQPTALLHEAFLRLTPQHDKDWQNRQHFFAVAAQLMRQVLVDHARRRGARKRNPGSALIELTKPIDVALPGATHQVDLLDLDRTLSELQAIDERRGRIVEMRFFGGLTIPEISTVLGLPAWAVKKDWMLAKAWLARRLRIAHG
jgi:RNA polymerase sigma factor (TIGR02999 family)